MQVAQRGGARLRAAGARPASAPRRAGDELPRRRRATRCGSRRCATAQADAGDGARGRRACWRASTRYSAARPRARRAVRHRRDLLRHPARALPARHRARAIPTWRRRSSAGRARRSRTRVALVHGDVSPKNILVGPHGPGAARRRVRLVGRPGVRPRVLPQPPAAEVPVDAAGDRRPSSPASTRWRAPTCAASTGSRATALERRAAALLPGLLLARVDGKSPVEYLTDEAERDARAARRAARCCADRSRGSARSRAAWRAELDS